MKMIIAAVLLLGPCAEHRSLRDAKHDATSVAMARFQFTTPQFAICEEEHDGFICVSPDEGWSVYCPLTKLDACMFADMPGIP